MANLDRTQSRIVPQHKTEAQWSDWLKETGNENFCPKSGEIIIFDPDENHNYARFKVGDGEKALQDLNFAGGGNTLEFDEYGNATFTENLNVEGNTTLKNGSLRINSAATTIGKDAIAVGENSQVGIKGYYITAVLFPSGKNDGILYVSKERLKENNKEIPPKTLTTSDDNKYKINLTTGYAVNDELTINNKNKYPLTIKITNIDDNSNKIGFQHNPKAEAQFKTIEPTNNNGQGLDSDEYMVMCLSKPNVENGVTIYTNGMAIGKEAKASGKYAFALGQNTIAFNHGVAEGRGTIATYASHAEGQETKALGRRSHAEGVSSEALGYVSHAEGMNTIAIGDYSHTEGIGTIAKGYGQHVQGQYNEEDTDGQFAHIVGWGTDKDNRENIHTVTKEGKGWYKGGLEVSDIFKVIPNPEDDDVVLEVTGNTELNGDLSLNSSSVSGEETFSKLLVLKDKNGKIGNVFDKYGFINQKRIYTEPQATITFNNTGLIDLSTKPTSFTTKLQFQDINVAEQIGGENLPYELTYSVNNSSAETLKSTSTQIIIALDANPNGNISKTCVATLKDAKNGQVTKTQKFTGVWPIYYFLSNIDTITEVNNAKKMLTTDGKCALDLTETNSEQYWHIYIPNYFIENKSLGFYDAANGLQAAITEMSGQKNINGTNYQCYRTTNKNVSFKLNIK